MAVFRYSNKSILFGGTNEYITMGDVLNFSRTDPFSISFWIKAPDGSPTGYVVTKVGNPGPIGWDIYVGDSGVGFDLNNANPGPHITVSAARTMFDNQWHHVVCTWNGDASPGAAGAKIYIDGILGPMTISSDTLGSNSITTTAPFVFGHALSTLFLVGYLDEASVYNKVLNAAEVYWVYNGGNPRDLYEFGAPSNLVAWWRMGDGDNVNTNGILDLGPVAIPNNVRDLSGNNYTGTMTNMESGDVVTDSPGGFFAKKSLLFDGVDEYVTMGNVLNFERTDPFTWSAWVKTSTAGVFQSIIAKFGDSATGIDFRISNNTPGYLALFIVSNYGGGNYFSVYSNGGGSPLSVTDGAWHHVVVSYDGSSSGVSGVIFYIDGMRQTTSAPADNLTSTILNSDSFTIGRRIQAAAPQYFSGNIDEVSIHNRVLSNIEIVWIYNSGIPRNLKDSNTPPGLVAWWRLGEGAYPGTMTNMEAGDIVTDAPARIYYKMRALDLASEVLPTYRTWTALNAPDFTASQYSGSFSGYSTKALSFGGTNEYVTMGDVLSFERTSPFSLSFWFKTTGSGYLISKMDSTPRGWGAYITTSSGIEFLLINTPATNLIDVFGPTGLNNGVWHHVVWTYSGSSTAAGVKCYVDGSLVGTSTSSDTLSSTTLSTGSLNLAARTNGTGVYTGMLDEVAVYNRELTSTEASWIYNTSMPRDLSLTAAPFGLVAWWRMGEWASTSSLLILDSGPSAVPNTVRDLSGNNYNGTMTAMETTDVVFDAPGRGQCAYFDGASYDMTIAYGGAVKAYDRTDRFSVSFWAKVNAYGIVCSKINASWQGWYVHASTAGYAITLRNTHPTNLIEVSTSGTTWEAGRWNHVVITYNGSSSASGVKIYVNGAAVSTSVTYDNLTASIVYSPTDQFKIGQAGGSSYFNGRMKDLAIWGNELTAAQVSWIYNSGQPRELASVGSPEGLDGWWRLGNGDRFQEFYDSGPATWTSTIVDNSLNNYAGTMTSMEASDIVYNAPGRGKSVEFGGTDEYVTMGNVLGYERTSPQSYSLWVKFSTSSTQMFLAKALGATTYRGVLVYGSNGNLLLQLINDASVNNRIQIQTTKTFNDGLWHHVVVTSDGSSTAAGCKIYVDNMLQTVTVLYDALTATILTTAAFTLGTRSSLDTFFTGSLDEVAVYDKELSVSEITWVYNAGVPRLLTDSGCPSNLQAWWRMGDGDTAPTLQDQTVNNYDGTMTNMESTDIVNCSPGGGFVQKSLLFDGVNEYVTMGNVLAFERTSRFSVSCWAKWTDSSYKPLVSKLAASVAYTGWELIAFPSGAVTLQLINNLIGSNYTLRSSVTGFNDGQWHHLCATYNGSSTSAGICIYIDGVDRSDTSAGTLSATIVSSASLGIGGRPTALDGYFPGNITEVSVYSRDLTAAEVSWIYNSGIPRDLKNTSGAPLSLVGWWRLGGSAYRSSSATGTWQTRILGDGPGLTSDFATKCLSFGGGEYVDMGNVCAFERTQAFSISCWARWVSTDYGTLVAKCDGSYTGYILYKYAGAVVFEFRGADASTFGQYSSSGDLGDGLWHHIVATYDGSSSKTGTHIFVDGVDRVYGGTGTLTGSIVTTAALRIGQRASDLSLTGNVDEVAIYNKQLSQTEVNWLFNSGVPRDLRQTNTPSNLVAWWRLGEGAYPGTMTNMESGDIITDAPKKFSDISIDNVSKPIVYYTMRAIDLNADPVSPTYRTWTVAGTPDYTASQYAGPYSGGSVNFSPAEIISRH